MSVNFLLSNLHEPKTVSHCNLVFFYNNNFYSPNFIPLNQNRISTVVNRLCFSILLVYRLKLLVFRLCFPGLKIFSILSYSFLFYRCDFHFFLFYKISLFFKANFILINNFLLNQNDFLNNFLNFLILFI
jgi:hypothetical protein